MENILFFLKEKRKDKEYNQQNVSEMLEKKGLKLDASNLSRYESGKVKKLDPKIIKALCEIYNISYLEIFEKLGFISKNEILDSNIKKTFQKDITETKVFKFKNFIKKMREERNLSLTKMGELTGVSYGNLNNFENGVRGIPTIDVMDKISKGLNLSDIEKKNYIVIEHLK